MPRFRSVLCASILLAAAGAAATSDAATDGGAVARGLDLFVHAPPRGAPGATLPVQVVALGFPTVVTLRALEGAEVEAVWDPESLGPGVSAAPPPVRATADRDGRVHLDVPIPPGPERKLKLLLGVRMGDRQRTRELSVERIRPHHVELFVPDERVVPGSAISAWIRVTSAATGQAVPGRKVQVSLLEGGVARHALVVSTDAAGTAMARVPIPWTDEPAWRWELTAHTLADATGSSGQAGGTLVPREETPGKPRLFAEWAEVDVRAGDKVKYVVRIRDGADRPVAGVPVRTWIGPRGTSPPKDKDAWDKIAVLARTDAAGEVRGEGDAPTTVVQGVGTTLQLVARAALEGHALEEADTVSVESPASSAELVPEAGAVVPGAEQRLLLRVAGARGEPISAGFTIEGDGLRATATTDAWGEAEVVWDAPADLGAFRNVGPCAGGVAAAVVVRPQGAVPALATRRGPFELCVEVNREATAILRPAPLLARVGDRVAVQVADAPAAARGRPGSGPWSVLVESENAGQTAGFWLDDGRVGGAFAVPEGAMGAWQLSAALPATAGRGRRVGGGLLVAPRVLPRLTASIAGGRAAPRGALDVALELGDGKGKGMPGSVSVIVVDLHGGGSTGGLEGLDTRRALCGGAGVEPDRCDAFLEGGAALDPLRRAVLAHRAARVLEPAADPGLTAREQLEAAFAAVLRSLEGAVFEAAASPEQLRDVRRKGARGEWQFNPELLTLVTAAMEPEPTTPGGEPLALGDLLAIDPQVTFDNVARRVTRLKLFRILADVRAFKHERLLDGDEPALRDPNAMLRRLLRDGRLQEQDVLDPWGGTIEFVKTNAPPFPFLTVARGFELRAPGPDGRLETADDVRDPFGRVLKSGTPYADAVEEDRIVDAKFDMEVGEATVSQWQTLFESLTGTALGAGGLGLSGVGEGGGGRGEGIGLGSIGTIGHGTGRGSFGVPTGVAYWSPPRRTDKDGRLRMSIPLGDVETTWRIAFVGVPDGATPATTTLDVPVSLPLSVRVDTGARWVEGDEVDAEITVRNRTGKPVRAALALAAGGAASLVQPAKALVADVPAGGATAVRARVRAAHAGRARLEVRATAPGAPADAVVHTWDVIPAGEPTDKTHSQWVEGGATLRAPGIDASIRKVGEPRLVLERGAEGALAAAIEAMDPDRLASPPAMADAVEVGARVQRWATARKGERSALAVRAGDVARRGVGRLLAYKQAANGAEYWAPDRRARAFGPSDVVAAFGKIGGECPGRPSMHDALDALDVEPSPGSGVALACWDAFVTDTTAAVTRSGDRVALARAVLALAERPHRAAMAAALAERLRAWVGLRPSGAIELPSHQASDRAARAVVYAALLRAVKLGKSAAPAPRLAAWIGVQRDVRGGYGTPLATRAVVRALLAEGDGGAGVTQVTVISGGQRRVVEVGPTARVVVPLDPAAMEVALETSGPGVVARLERPVLRLWSSPPDEVGGPIHVEATWPERPRAGRTAPLRVALRHTLDREATLDVRIPLPPGVSLAAPVDGVRQVQGTLVLRQELDASRLPVPLEIPLRFGLAGRVTVPELRARVAYEDLPRAVAPARALRIE